MLSRILKIVGVIALLSIGLILIFAKKMSDEVLVSFETMNQKFEENNKSKTDSINKLLNKHNINSSELNKNTQELYDFIKSIKTDIASDYSKPDDYSEMSKSKHLDSIFFKDDNISIKGQEFVTKLNQHKTYLLSLTKDNDELIKEITYKFNTDPINKQHWLDYNFKGFPSIASIAKFSSLQSDLKEIEYKILQHQAKNKTSKQ